MEADSVAEIYIEKYRKNQLNGFELTFFLGWFGLFYASFTGGILFIFVSVALGLSLYSLPPSQSASVLPSMEDRLNLDEVIPEFLSAMGLIPEYTFGDALLFLILVNWAACIALSAILIFIHNKKVMAFAELIAQSHTLLQPQAKSQLEEKPGFEWFWWLEWIEWFWSFGWLGWLWDRLWRWLRWWW